MKKAKKNKNKNQIKSNMDSWITSCKKTRWCWISWTWKLVCRICWAHNNTAGIWVGVGMLDWKCFIVILENGLSTSTSLCDGDKTHRHAMSSVDVTENTFNISRLFLCVCFGGKHPDTRAFWFYLVLVQVLFDLPRVSFALSAWDWGIFYITHQALPHSPKCM